VLDTPARAACAGFWLLSQNDAAQAAQAFAVVRDLAGGEACYRLARALALAQRCSSFGDLAALGVDESFLTATQPPDGDPLAQRETWPALGAGCGRAAQEAHTVQMSVSRLVRSQALNRALAEVNEVLTGIEQIPRAERETGARDCHDLARSVTRYDCRSRANERRRSRCATRTSSVIR
jgi:hypothetical protein